MWDGYGMSVNWDGYAPFDPGVTRPLHEVTKREARGAFQRLMAAKDERIAMLRELLERNGVALSSEGDGLHALNNWFRSEVEGGPGDGTVATDLVRGSQRSGAVSR